MKTDIKRIVSIILVAAILIQVPNFTALAALSPGQLPITSETELETEQLDHESKDDKNAVIIGEEESLRDQAVKRFRRSDGTYTAVMYGEPVHYDVDGEWKDIDNSLTYEEGYYKNRANSFRVYLPAKIDGGKSASISVGGYGISFAPLHFNTSDAVIKPAVESNARVLKARLSELAEALATGTPADISAVPGIDAKTAAMSKDELVYALNAEYMTVRKTWSEASYEDVFNGADIKYEILSSKLKESIILKTPEAQCLFSFLIDSNGLTGMLQSDGSVLFYDENKVIFTIAAPYMWDAEDTFSADVAVSLEKTEGGYIYTIAPDSGWLSSPNRVYPVTVDPTFQYGDFNTINDKAYAFVEPLTTGDKNALLNETFLLRIGKLLGGTEAGSLIHADIIGALDLKNARILNVDLVMRYYGSFNATNLQINAYAVTTPVSTWSNLTDPIFPSALSLVYDSSRALEYLITPSSQSGVHNTYHTFDITNIAWQWQKQSGPANNGILLRAVNIPSYGDRLVTFYDSSMGGTVSDPKFIITYRDAKGLESYWTYTTMPAGRYGAAAVNNFNGNIVVAQDVAGAGGLRMPLSVSLVYNSATGDNHHSHSGIGWQTNCHLRIRTSTIPDYPYFLVDADGTEHYFYGTAGATKWVDEDGLGYTLTKTSTTYTITDAEGTTMEFNSGGYLTSINDTNGNKILITYQSGAFGTRVFKITDGAGRIYTFNYLSGCDTIASIKEPDGQSVTFGYDSTTPSQSADSSRKLLSITYPDGKATTFTYLSGTSRISRINDIDGTSVRFTYTTDVRASAINYYTSAGVLNTGYTFNYEKHNTTRISDNTGRSFDYQFNSAGQTAGVVNVDTGQAQYFEYGAPGIGDTGALTGNENKLLTVSDTQVSVVNMMSNGSFNSDASGYTKYPSGASEYSFSRDAGFGNLSKGSLKTVRNSGGSGSVFLYQSKGSSGSPLPAGTYTLSMYVSTNGALLPGGGISANTDVFSGGTYQTTYASTPVKYTQSGKWLLMRTTLTLNGSQYVNVGIATSADTSGTFWVDDIQFEKSDGANSINLLQNASFSGLTSWSVPGSSTNPTISGNAYLAASFKAACMMGDAKNVKTVSQEAIVGGSKGDVFSFGGWGMAKSVSLTSLEAMLRSRTYGISLTFYNGNTALGESYISFNPNVYDWQYITGMAVAPANYTKVVYKFSYDYNCNEANFAAPYLYKETYGQSYTYDKNGNVISTVDLSKSEAQFAYQNNRLSKLLNPTGSRFMYSYNSQTKTLSYALNSNGQRYGFTYDSYGNATGSKINIDKPVTTIVSGKTYIVVNAGDGGAMSSTPNVIQSNIFTEKWDPNNANLRWQINESAAAGLYLFKSVASSQGYGIYMKNGATADGNPLALTTYTPTSTNQRMEIVANGDGTFRILTRATDTQGNKKCFDTRNTATTPAAAVSDIQQYPYTELESQRWYFYEYKTQSAQDAEGYIQSEAGYGGNGNFMTSLTDSRGKTTSYTYNESRGLLTSETSPGGHVTNYVYDANNDLLTRVYSGTSEVRYEYTNDLLTTIRTHQQQMRYVFTYNTAGQRTKLEVGNGTTLQTLTQYQYNARNLTSRMTYGNGEYAEYFYDELDRLVKLRYNGNESRRTEYFYDGTGRLAQINDPESAYTTRYAYDMAGRTVEVLRTGTTGAGVQRFRVGYDYEIGTNRLSGYTRLTLTNASANAYRTEKTEFVYGNAALGQMADAVYSIKHGQCATAAPGSTATRLAYTYDGFGRLTVRSLSAISKTTEYTYQTVSGTRTSTVVSKVKNGTEELTYTYDNNGNILTIAKNGVLQESFVYDSLNQLTRVNSVPQNKTILYAYDGNGNMLSRSEYAYTTGTPSGTPVVTSYGYDSVWRDKLTSYGGQSITYDAIGNPLTYRDGMSFTWVHGRELAGVTKSGATTSYTYDENGIRVQKISGGVTTTYHVECVALMSRVEN